MDTSKKDTIILVGGGGHCASCIDVIEQEGKYQIMGILDDDEAKLGTEILGYKVIGKSDELVDLKKTCTNYLVTVGQIKSAAIRFNLYNKLLDIGVNLPVIISPSAYVSKHSKIGRGTIIMHQAIVNANSTIGENCIINSKALIEHDSNIGNHCHISTCTIINGTVVIGDNCFVGSNATIANNISISNDVVIASGSVVFKNIKKEGTYAGNPAKQIG